MSKPCFVTASAVRPQAEPWFQIKALSIGEEKVGELRLRGYIGAASTYQDYWTGEERPTGGAGTLQEFEAALLALGDVTRIDLYITSEGGDFPTAIAISSILARQKAKIVCTIDGYAYSAAPVIACAADEVKAAGNALLMIHDAEFWCAGADVETLQKHIQTLTACNDSMAAAFINKAGGSKEEWMGRMMATTWMTGAQAAELKLVDTVLDDVALSAYEPLHRITSALQAPAEIRALIDKQAPAIAANANPSITPTVMLRPRTPLLTAAADPAAAQPPGAAAPPAAAPAAAPLTLEQITAAVGTAVSAAVKPLEDKITAQETEINRLKGLEDHGLGKATAAATAPVIGAPPAGGPPKTDLGQMTAMQLIGLGRQTATPTLQAPAAAAS